jgi:hypothetical protein
MICGLLRLGEIRAFGDGATSDVTLKPGAPIHRFQPQTKNSCCSGVFNASANFFIVIKAPLLRLAKQMPCERGISVAIGQAVTAWIELFHLFARCCKWWYMLLVSSALKLIRNLGDETTRENATSREPLFTTSKVPPLSPKVTARPDLCQRNTSSPMGTLPFLTARMVVC